MNKDLFATHLNEVVREFLSNELYSFDKKNLNYTYFINNYVFFQIDFKLLKSLVSNNILGYKIEIHISVFNLAIDELFKSLSKRYKQLKIEKQPLLSSDIGTLMANSDLEKKVINNPYYIEISCLEDFERQHKKFQVVFEQYVFPFIEKFKSLEEQYKALQFDPLKKHVLNMWPAERLMKSIILAKIIGKSDWKLLFDKYESTFSTTFNEVSKEEFYNLQHFMLNGQCSN